MFNSEIIAKKFAILILNKVELLKYSDFRIKDSSFVKIGTLNKATELLS